MELAGAILKGSGSHFPSPFFLSAEGNVDMKTSWVIP